MEKGGLDFTHLRHTRLYKWDRIEKETDGWKHALNMKITNMAWLSGVKRNIEVENARIKSELALSLRGGVFFPMKIIDCRCLHYIVSPLSTPRN